MYEAHLEQPYCVGINRIIRVRILFAPVSCKIGKW